MRVMKTYAWMQATADSRIESVSEIGTAKIFCAISRFERAFPSNVINK